MPFTGRISDIPIVIDGVRVGIGSIDDGQFSFTLGKHSKQYYDLIVELLVSGHANAISISTHHDPSFWTLKVEPDEKPETKGTKR